MFKKYKNKLIEGSSEMVNKIINNVVIAKVFNCFNFYGVFKKYIFVH